MKLINFKILPLLLVGFALFALSGCDGTTGTSSDSGLAYAGTAPVAVDDNATGISGETITISVIANDTDIDNDIDVSSVQISGGNFMNVPGEGNWTVDTEGNVTFTPESSFTGDPTPITYTVADDIGLVSNEANITIDYTQTYFENNTSYPIPDYTTTTSDITATNAVTAIAHITVTINITQPWVMELEIRLISPTGTNILLSSNNGGTGGYYNVTFDDNALTSIIGASQPLTDGTYYPEEPLANFDGEDANGVWTLSVTETNGFNDNNILTSWNITIE